MLTFRQVRLILFSLLYTFITTIKTVAYIICRGILENVFVLLSPNNVFQKILCSSSIHAENRFATLRFESRLDRS